MENLFRNSIERVKRRIRTLLLRAIVQAIDDKTPIQLVQVNGLADEVLDKVERLQNYGMTSNPPVGSEAFVAFVGGDRSAGVILAIEDRRYRVKSLSPGEVCIYTDEGDYVRFCREKKIHLFSGNQVIVEAPNIVEQSTNHKIVTQNFELETESFYVKASDSTVETPVLNVTGDVLDQSGGNGKTMSSMRSTFNTHTHKENNQNGGYTDTPKETM